MQRLGDSDRAYGQVVKRPSEQKIGVVRVVAKVERESVGVLGAEIASRTAERSAVVNRRRVVLPDRRRAALGDGDDVAPDVKAGGVATGSCTTAFPVAASPSAGGTGPARRAFCACTRCWVSDGAISPWENSASRTA